MFFSKMRYSYAMKRIFSLLLFAAVFNAVLCTPSFGTGESEFLTEERSFTTTKLRLSDKCKLEKFNELCLRFSSYLISNFERQIVVMNNANIDYDDPATISSNLTPKEQTIDLIVKEIKKLDFAIIEANIKQNIDGKINEFVQCFNVVLSTGEYLRFKDLFEVPELASMICARAIEHKFSEHRTKALIAVVSLTEVNPTNFMLRPNGLEFLFAPNTVTTDGKQASVLVTLDELSRAKPVEKWFPER